MEKAIVTIPGDASTPREVHANTISDADRAQYKRLKAVFNCKCGEPLVFVKGSKGIAAPISRHFRVVSRVPHEQAHCPWLEAEVPHSKHDAVTFAQSVRDGYAVILNLTPNETGITYSYGRSRVLGVPDAAIKAEDKIPEFGGRYLNVGVKDMGTLVKTLAGVVDTVGHLDNVYVRHGSSPRQGPYETGLRPVKEMLMTPQKPGRHPAEIYAAWQGVQARHARADTKRERDLVGSVAMFPQLVRLEPAQGYMQDVTHGKLHGAMPTNTTPHIRSTRTGLMYQNPQNRSGAIIFTHDINFPDAATRAEAVAGFEKRDPVFAVVTPRVNVEAFWQNPNGKRPSKMNYSAKVMDGMMQVGPLPARVLAALVAPVATKHDPKQQLMAFDAA